MATFSGDDIVEWTLIAYYGGLEEDRIFGTTIMKHSKQF